MNIGIFDFGLGGVLLLKDLAKELPQYDYIFYADTTNSVEDNTSQEDIITYSKNGLDELLARECAVIVIASRFVLEETLDKLRLLYPKQHIIDGQIPVGVLATQFIQSGSVTDVLDDIGIGKRDIILSEHSASSDRIIADYLGGSFIKTED